jgi:hypothetical protein
MFAVVLPRISWANARASVLAAYTPQSASNTATVSNQLLLLGGGGGGRESKSSLSLGEANLSSRVAVDRNCGDVPLSQIDDALADCFLVVNCTFKSLKATLIPNGGTRRDTKQVSSFLDELFRHGNPPG